MIQILRPFYEFIAITGTSVIVYGLIMRRCAEAVQPSRLRMIALAERLEEAGTSEEDHKVIQFALDHAFSAWLAIATAILLPIAFVVVLVRDRASGVNARGEQSPMMKDFLQLSFVSMLAANPLVALLVLFEIAVVVLVAATVFAQEAMVKKVVLGTVQRMDLMSATATMLRAV